MGLREQIDKLLLENEKKLWEGVVIRINKLVSDAIKVPEGDYRVLVGDCDRCTLVSTNEASKQTFEVMRPTLAGFFNPEVHKKQVGPITSKVIAEDR